jgi:pimeloyl-ACP methyl ester carboxylesterase
MGFNLGSTRIRQAQRVEDEDRPERFIFESPLIRLMKDEGYVDAYEYGDLIDESVQVDSRSVWIFRYYEQDSKSFGDGSKETIVSYAEDLRDFILRIRRQVCQGDRAEEARFKVHLVAHSMGGLICRTYLQNVARGREHHVDKVFTYATPHGGIEMMGLNAPDFGRLDKMHIRNFTRKYMKDYLKLSDGAAVTSLDGQFPPERFFCLVGTNYKDYHAFHGLSRRGTGALSDGLVMMSNAAVDGAPRAYAHRSHSGHYGIVNSEEGYQNLRRFLFGQVKVTARLAVDEIPLPPAVQEKKDSGSEIHAKYNIDVAAKVRGGGYYMTERRVRNESAVRRSYDDLVKGGRPAFLFTGYLLKGAKTDARDTALAFAIELEVEVPVFEVDRRFWFDEHFEGQRLLNETVTLHLRHGGGKASIKYGLQSRTDAGRAPTPLPLPGGKLDGTVELEIPIGFREGARRPPRPGFRGRLLLTVSPWS